MQKSFVRKLEPGTHITHKIRVMYKLEIFRKISLKMFHMFEWRLSDNQLFKCDFGKQLP